MPNTSRTSSRTRGSTRASSGARDDGGDPSEATDEDVVRELRQAFSAALDGRLPSEMANAFMAGVDRREVLERTSTSLDAPCNPDGSTMLTKAAEEIREARDIRKGSRDTRR